MNAPNKTKTRAKLRRTLAFLDRTPLSEQEDVKRSCRVSGPYYDGNNNSYRLVVFDGTKRKSVGVKTEAEALALKAELEEALKLDSSVSVGAALAEYLEHKRKAGLKPLSMTALGSKLRSFLPLDEAMCSIGPEEAQKLYDAAQVKKSRYDRPLAAITHRKLLGFAKMFFAWATERKLTRINPFSAVQPVGKPRVGKEQLRIDEARALTQVLLAAAERGEEGAVSVYTQLVLGLRTSEVLHRQVRDLDDEGRVLWIPSGKTDNARRRLEVPESVRPYLLTQVHGKSADELIFDGKHQGANIWQAKNAWQWRQVKKYCAKAGLRRVCPHSLRGLHSSLAIAAGCSSTVVASALGHGSFRVTAKHYVDADTLRNSSVRRVASALDSQPRSETAGPSLLEQLRALTPEERAALLDALKAS